jgi:hypothetical protein
MKIRADKIQGDPSHALQVMDVARVLAAVPADWTKEISSVRLTNSQDQQSYAFFSANDGCLTIFSRGSTQEQALRAILTELAAHVIGVNKPFGRRLSNRESQRVHKLIQPHMDELLPGSLSPTGR